MDWTVYILKCADSNLYTGISDDVESRLKRHELGTGAKYTRGRGPFELVYTEKFKSHREAAQREFQIKGWSRVKKLNLIKYGKPIKKI